MAASTEKIRAPKSQLDYVGTIVGESTSREFRLAVAREAIREQDIIAVDAELQIPNEDRTEKLRIWAKVQRIERINPLFPAEAGHELAETQTSPFDTVLSLSREMVTAVCQVLGSEPLEGAATAGKLDHLRYPAQPASSAYRPGQGDLERVVLGDLRKKQHRALDLATLANRPEVSVSIDGHMVVTRHVAILAMTGAGKSWAARRMIEQLASKNYPIVIFDPRGDYTGLADVPGLKGKVRRYYAKFPLFDEDAETVAQIVSSVGYRLSDAMVGVFSSLFDGATSFYIPEDSADQETKTKWLADRVSRPDWLRKYGIQPDLWLLAYLAEAAEGAARNDNQADLQQLQAWGWETAPTLRKTDVRTLEGIKRRTLKAAAVFTRMEQTNKKVSHAAKPLPTDRKELVHHGEISIVALAGYTGDFQATIYTLVADAIFGARVSGDLKLPVVLVLEEAHNFVPPKANTPAEDRSITITKQIAQEGRKFGVGLILISQRPSRLDETTLSQCNSYVIMRMVNPADQNFVRRVVETIGEDEANLLPDLDVGEAVLSGQFINFPILAKIKPPESQGEHEEEDAFVHLEQCHKNLSDGAK